MAKVEVVAYVPMKNREQTKRAKEQRRRRRKLKEEKRILSQMHRLAKKRLEHTVLEQAKYRVHSGFRKGNWIAPVPPSNTVQKDQNNDVLSTQGFDIAAWGPPDE